MNQPLIEAPDPAFLQQSMRGGAIQTQGVTTPDPDEDDAVPAAVGYTASRR